MKKLILCVLIMTGCQKEQPKKLEILKTSTDMNKIAYSLGSQYGSSVKSLGMSDKDIEFLILGLKDRVVKKQQMGQAEINFYLKEVQKLIKKNKEASVIDTKAVGIKWIKNILSSGEGFSETNSGLVYKVLLGGKVKKILDTDKIGIRYHSFDKDGKIINTMKGRNALNLPYGRMFKAWQEAYLISGVNSEIDFSAPSELTYGSDGALPQIKPGQYIKYRLEFFDILLK